jgi:16S rRNA (uracil1498-N3)-methyltransferase
MKQSLKTYLPTIHLPKSFEKLINTSFNGIKLIAHCGNSARIALNEVLKKQQSTPHQYLILIGPEGDFSSDEIALAEAKGFQSIHLGASRLRTETAGVAATLGIYLFTMPTSLSTHR